MKKIIIFGAGGLGRDVQWLIERINDKQPTWEIVGYIVDNEQCGKIIDGYQILGNTDTLLSMREPISVVCAIGSSELRKKVVNRLKANPFLSFPNLIDPSVILSKRVKIGEGNIICAASVITVNVTINDFVLVSIDCTVEHDVELASFVTLYPSVNISGNVYIGEKTEIGVGTQIIQKKKVLNNVIVGAGAVVISDIPENCTAVGVPARVIKYH